MRKILNNPLVVAGLCLIAGIIIYLNGPESAPEPSRKPMVSPKKIEVASTMETSRQETKGTIEVDKLGWTESIVRDPFGPTPTREKARARKTLAHGRGQPTTSRKRSGKDARLFRSLKLNAIAMEADSRIAVINRSIVKEHDRINGFQVDRIDPDGVTLKGPSGAYRLTFQRERKES